MSNEKSVIQNNATPAPAAAVSPESIVEQLRAIRAQIPEYVQLPVASTRAMGAVAHVHPDFTQAAIGAMGTSDTVTGAVGSTPEVLQQDVDTAGRWAVVEDELRAMLQGVATANLSRRHRIGGIALLTYAVSQKLVRSADHADLLPHVKVMRSLNKFGKARKAAKQSAPATPEPVPSSPAPKV